MKNDSPNYFWETIKIMKHKKLLSSLLISSLLLGCNSDEKSDNTAAQTPADEVKAVSETNANNLLAEWKDPFQGVPDFGKAKLADLKPALEEGMRINLAEVDAIINNSEKPTFENTIVAMERTGQELNRIFTHWGIWSNNMSTPEFRKIQTEMVPKLSAFSSKINLNKDLFARVKAVFEGDEMKTLRPDQQRLVTITYDGFARNGANLKDHAKERFAAINQRLAELHTKFSNNVLADEEGYVLYLNKTQLSGLPESLINAASSAAKDRKHEDEYAITNTRSSMSPFLTYSDERELRKKVWETYYNRGDNGDEFDNNALITEILKLRHERVQLLGYPNYASWRLENRMAKNPANAIKLMESVWPAAIARVKEEVADMQAIADQEDIGDSIKPWDYRYYAEKVRQAKYNLDSNEVKQYLQLDKLREAMFYVAGRLFDFQFTPVKEGSVPVFHEDVKVWEVTDKTTAKHIGLWYLDPFARKGKRSGAWATSYRNHTTYDGVKNVLSSNNSNFMKGKAGEVTLISWDDAETYFHEFGHALHSLSSQVVYPTLNGGVRDYTEFQSQLLENWLSTDEVINQFLVHHETGKPMPAELIGKIKKAATFNSGFKTTEYLASALVDMRFHTTDPANIDPDKFERETLATLNMPEQIVMRHRTPHFSHIFSGEGYSAGYYGYLWAEVLTADAAEYFANSQGGFYDKDIAAKLVKHLFSVRNSVDPAEAYRAFRGQDANVDALMRDRGFPVAKKDKPTK